MPTVAELFDRALRHHQEGDLRQAEPLYRQVLQADPVHADAHHLLGVLAHQTGRHDEAVQLVRQALVLNPAATEYLFNLGAIHKDQRNFAEAEACFRQALRINPQYVGALDSLGDALREQGRLTEAIACFRQARQIDPRDGRVLNNLGVALQDQGQVAEAIACYREALALAPTQLNANYNLANALMVQGELAEAIEHFEQTLRINPKHVQSHINLANALLAQGQSARVVEYCQRALKLDPDNFEALNTLGAGKVQQGLIAEAAVCFQKALQRNPASAAFHGNLGVIMQEQGRLDDAVDCYRQAFKLEPTNLEILGIVIHLLQHLCLWKEMGDLLPRAVQAIQNDGGPGTTGSFTPFSILTLPLPTTPQQQLFWACNESKKFAQFHGERRIAPRPRADKTKITVGYLSSDFRVHAIASLVAELFELHDRSRFQVIGYSYGPDDGSSMRRRLERGFDRFVDLKDVSFLESARRIMADEVDILVDLNGYTKKARTQILAQRPAPIQVNYLGFPGTMGAPFIDYILVDETIVPPHQQPFYMEKIVYLPECYEANDRRREIAERTPSRAECGLPARGFVFCNFNLSYKITPSMFDVWMDLLKAVPGSVLWLLEGNRFASANLRREAEARGVAPERLVFAPKMPVPEHLARHRLADLFLDTFPYCAQTTASDALWTGCPLLTLAGETFASRVAGSVLRTVGLFELITASFEEYQAMALRLASDAGLLMELRSRLAANRETSSLFDSERFTRNLEKAYAQMWATRVRGEEPCGFAVK